MAFDVVNIYYVVKKNCIGLKDFRNFDVLLLLTNSFRKKFEFNLAQTWLWCNTMKKGVDISRGSTYLLVNKHLQESSYHGKKRLGSTYLLVNKYRVVLF